MGRSKGIFALLGLLFVIGVSGLVQFSQNLFQASENVRSVDVVGLSGGAAACGAVIFGVIFSMFAGRRPTESKDAPGNRLRPR
jgi:hypothetical protein